MGKKGSWISAVKKALSFDPKDKNHQNPKNKWFKKNIVAETAVDIPSSPSTKAEKTTRNEQNNNDHTYSLAIATAAAAEAAAAAAQAAAEVVRLTTGVRHLGRSNEEIAAIKIQTAFRGYLARRTLRAFRGLMRLKSLIHGQSVQRQSTTTLQYMQTLARMQSQIHARRVRMSEEKLQAFQRELQEKCDKEQDNKLEAPVVEDWNASAQSKEQMKAKLQYKEEAAMRRERALAYAHSQQRVKKDAPKRSEANHTYIDQNDLNWGWSWLERWMAARPWENKNTTQDKGHVINDQNKASLKNKNNTNRAPTNKPLSTTPSKARPLAHKISPKKSNVGANVRSSERPRRHSIATSSMRDDESIVSSSTDSSHKGNNEGVKAKAKPHVASRLGNVKSDKGAFGSAKKQLTYSTSAAGVRRHSGPAKVAI